MNPAHARTSPRPLSSLVLQDPPPRLRVPGYDRRALRPGILHVGLGNFHRADQAVCLDDLFASGRDHDWAIVGAGLMPFDQRQRALLEPQDWLYSVTEVAPDGVDARIIGAMVDFCPTTAADLIARIADPAIRIVSLTITEGGYFIDAETGGFDHAHKAIRADAAAPDAPSTVFGVLLAGLRLRRDRGIAPPTILSCDNIEGNGRVTQAALAGLAEMQSPALGAWVEAEIVCPNSMVDRITPTTTATEIQMVARDFGLQDAAPVICEPFRQWVLEDRFAQGRPMLEQVGAQFVPDVAPYETMKLRILNAGHAAIAYPAALLGHAWVHDAMADPDIDAWLRALMQREVMPVLSPIPGEDYAAYLDMCRRRFANPGVRDTIARLCQDGSNRQPKFVLPTLAEALAQGRSVRGLALEVAFWARYAAQAAREGALDDPRAAQLGAAALAARDRPDAFLEQPDIFGPLARDDRFRRKFVTHVTRLWREPARAVLRNWLAEGAA